MNGNKSNQGLVVFSHIPKTAGTSLLRIIEDNYAADEVAFLYGPEGERRREAIAGGEEGLGGVRCVCLHQATSILKRLPGPYRLFAMVRHPVEHNISLFHFLMDKARPGEDGMKVVKRIRKKGWSLEDIYRNVGGRDPRANRLAVFFNSQSQVICNTVGMGQRLLPGKSAKNEILNALGLGRFVPHEELTVEAAGELIDDALNLWATRGYLLGVTEAFEESVARFAAEFGWTKLRVPHENRSRRPRGEAISKELRELILRYNRADLLLWERVAGTFPSLRAGSIRTGDPDITKIEPA